VLIFQFFFDRLRFNKSRPFQNASGDIVATKKYVKRIFFPGPDNSPFTVNFLELTAAAGIAVAGNIF
jgi:hypothetical protein